MTAGGWGDFTALELQVRMLSWLKCLGGRFRRRSHTKPKHPHSVRLSGPHVGADGSPRRRYARQPIYWGLSWPSGPSKVEARLQVRRDGISSHGASAGCI